MPNGDMATLGLKHLANAVRVPWSAARKARFEGEAYTVRKNMIAKVVRVWYQHHLTDAGRRRCLTQAGATAYAEEAGLLVLQTPWDVLYGIPAGEVAEADAEVAEADGEIAEAAWTPAEAKKGIDMHIRFHEERLKNGVVKDGAAKWSQIRTRARAEFALLPDDTQGFFVKAWVPHARFQDEDGKFQWRPEADIDPEGEEASCSSGAKAYKDMTPQGKKKRARKVSDAVVAATTGMEDPKQVADLLSKGLEGGLTAHTLGLLGEALVRKSTLAALVDSPWMLQVVPALAGLRYRKQNIGGFVFAKALVLAGVKSLKEARKIHDGMATDLKFGPQCWRQAQTMSVSQYVAMLRVPRNNGRSLWCKTPSTFLQDALHRCSQPSCQFLMPRGVEAEKAEQGLIVKHTLTVPKADIVRERVGKRKEDPKRSTLYRNMRRDWREYGKGSKRSDVCPVEHRFDNWLTPVVKDRHEHV